MMLFKSCSLSLCRLVPAVYIVFVVILCILFYSFFVNLYNVCIGNIVDR